MDNHRILFSAVGFLMTTLLASSARSAEPPTLPQVADLRCEYLVNPLGLHETLPRLQWVIGSARRGDRQTAYRILIASTPALLAKDQGDLWDTGKVSSDENAQIVYAGKPLDSRQACFWKVRTWDIDDKPTAWSTPASWEMGLLNPRDWSAKWTSAVLPSIPAADTLESATWIWFPEPNVDLQKEAPAGERYFRTTLHLPATPLTAAHLIISVDDSFVLLVNGRQVATFDEKDGWRKPRQCDIAKLLSAGDNVIAIAGTNKQGPAGLCAKIVYTLGQSQHILTTNRKWKTSDKLVDGWTAAKFDDTAWKDAAEIAPYGQGVWGGTLSANSAVPALRKSFKLADKPIARARLFATALGLYELSINGTRAGDHILAPDWTDYRKRSRYQVYDVTAALKPGENVLAGLLANGWYSGHIGNGGFRYFGKNPALLAQLEITYADGTTDRIISDDSWKMSPSAILASDFMLGESYDARNEIPGWKQPAFDDAKWTPVAIANEPPRPLEGQVTQPVRKLLELKAKSVSEPAPGRFTFDLGQNMVGVVRLKISAPAGTKLLIRHAEMLNPDGTIYTANLRGAPSVDCYWCKGGGEETWQPAFTFHGFRYVELDGLPAKPALDAITGIVIGTDTPQAGTLVTSDPRLNQLQSNIVWGQRGNYLSVPTDCPQRDERLGWMGDAQVFIRTATMNADVAAFFTKWLVDVDDGQSPQGSFSDVAPNTGSGNSVPAWGDAGVICPWTIYQAYGDKRILERHLPAMTQWIEYLKAHSTNLIRDKNRGNDYGDWLSIGANTPKELIGTAYFAYSTHLLAKSYLAVGNQEQAAKYDKLFAEIKTAFNKKYVAADGRIAGNTQCCYAMALNFELLPKALEPKAAQYLEDDIKAKGWHLSTGFVGVSYLLPVLTRMGKVDTAYRLLMQDTFPSWLFSVKHGATTIWERWDGWTPEKGFQDPGMNSFNHYSLGSCGQWLYESAAGISPDPDKPGYKHVLIHPRIGGGLSSVSATLRTQRGSITSAWSIHDRTFTLNVTIPVHATATVYIPATAADQVTESGKPAAQSAGVTFTRLENNEAIFEIGSGTYQFQALLPPETP